MLWATLASLRRIRAAEELAELLVVCLCPGLNLASPYEGPRDSSSCCTAGLDEETLPPCLAACFLCTPWCFFFFLPLKALSRCNTAPRFFKKRLELWGRMLHCEHLLAQAKQLETTDRAVCAYLRMTRYFQLTTYNSTWAAEGGNSCRTSCTGLTHTPAEPFSASPPWAPRAPALLPLEFVPGGNHADVAEVVATWASEGTTAQGGERCACSGSWSSQKLPGEGGW